MSPITPLVRAVLASWLGIIACHLPLPSPEGLGGADASVSDADPTDAAADAVVPTDDAGVDAGADLAVDGGEPPPTSGALQVDLGYAHSCARMVAGTIYCWGSGGYGRLGDGNASGSTVPVQVAGIVDAVDVSGGGYHSCAALSTGQARCWGANGWGMLGTGDKSEQHQPTPVEEAATNAPLAGVLRVASGNIFSCAVLAGGGARCWGGNDNGSLGDGKIGSDSLRAVPVKGLGDARWLAASQAAGTSESSRVCAVRVGGALSCWGVGPVGDGTHDDRDTPTPVALSDVVDVAVSSSHGCAVTGSGAVHCWGKNGEGQLGNGDTQTHVAPTLVQGLPPMRAVASSIQVTCAVTRTAGEVVCWGGNEFGELGLPTTSTGGPEPRTIAGLAGVRQIAAGRNHFCVVQLDGAVRCWGRNDDGQLGDGTKDDSPSPVPVDLPPQ